MWKRRPRPLRRPRQRSRRPWAPQCCPGRRRRLAPPLFPPNTNPGALPRPEPYGPRRAGREHSGVTRFLNVTLPPLHGHPFSKLASPQRGAEAGTKAHVCSCGNTSRQPGRWLPRGEERGRASPPPPPNSTSQRERTPQWLSPIAPHGHSSRAQGGFRKSR